MPQRLIALLTASAIGVSAIAPMAVAQDDLPFPVQARQGQFTMMGLNIGVLVGMARGERDYDAAAAQAAADNLVAISTIDQSFHWPEGTDNASLSGTRALPAIWEDLPDVNAKWEAFGAAAEGLADVAGDGLEPMQAAIGPLGATCSDCHDSYRADE
ncbi:MAG: c-type cytochrome [Roseicyclus sp.]